MFSSSAMTSRTNPRLLKKVMALSKTFSSKTEGNSRRAHLRQMSSCGTLLSGRMGLSLVPTAPTLTPSRGFINLAAAISPRRMEYSESRTLGFTPEQMYNIVAAVDQYQHFVPWCKKSRTMKTRNCEVRAELEIGFSPVVERYTSEVTCVPNHLVRAVCRDGTLFSHLETIWRFAPGPTHTPDSCKVEFFVSFEFKSLLHSQLAGVFFDEVAKQMVSAFESRAAALYRSQPEISLRRKSTS